MTNYVEFIDFKPSDNENMARRPLLDEDESEDSPVLGDEGPGEPDEVANYESVNPDHQGSRDRVEVEEGNKKFLYILTFFSALGGFLFGYDTGVVSGAMLLLRDVFSLNVLWQELVVSATIGAAAVFALVGGVTSGKFGRRPTIMSAGFIFTVGALLLGLAQDRSMLLAGRIVVGAGIGLASMAVPMYIAEAAPPSERGRLVTLNNIFITGGQFIASVVDGIFSYDKEDGWRYMLGLAGIPSLIMLIGFIFLPESPRWLVDKGLVDRARLVLRKMRGKLDVEVELQEIQDACEAAAQQRQLTGGGSTVMLMLTTPHVRRALILGCSLQFIQQVSGINTVMYYSATIIKMSGVKSESSAIWLSALTASFNFIFTFVGLYLVDKIGRRKLTLGSLIGTAISLAVLALGFQLAAFKAPDVTLHPHFNTSYQQCTAYSGCNSCMSDKDCGFCYVQTDSGVTNSSCLPVNIDPVTGVPDMGASAVGRCNDTDLPPGGVQWAYDYCPTDVAWMATFGLLLYLACFAPGMGPMPWTVNSEIYPLWARSTGNALSTATNWVMNLLVAMTFLTLTEALTRYGAFWLYTGLATLGVILLSFIMPETKGRTLEEVEQIFKKPWCS